MGAASVRCDIYTEGRACKIPSQTDLAHPPNHRSTYLYIQSSLSSRWAGLYRPTAGTGVLRPRRYRYRRPVTAGGKNRRRYKRRQLQPPQPPTTREIPHYTPNSEAPGGGRAGPGQYSQNGRLEVPTSALRHESTDPRHDHGEAICDINTTPDTAAAGPKRSIYTQTRPRERSGGSGQLHHSVRRRHASRCRF